MDGLSSRDDLPTLGQIGLSDYTIEIYADAHESAEEVGYTHLHEHSHQKLLFSTAFGALQTVLGVASPASPGGPAGWGAQADALLDEAMAASWTADEGYAVYSELVLSRLLGHQGEPAALPDDYAAAFEVYRGIALRLPAAVRPLEAFVVDAVAQAAFNGGILAAWKPESGTAAELRALLRDPLHRPDARLARFAAFLSLDQRDAERLLAASRRAAEAHGAAGMPLDEMARAAWDPANRALRDALLDAAGDVVADAAARCCPELTVLPPDRARAQVVAFLTAARTLLAAHGGGISPGRPGRERGSDGAGAGPHPRPRVRADHGGAARVRLRAGALPAARLGLHAAGGRASVRSSRTARLLCACVRDGKGRGHGG